MKKVLLGVLIMLFLSFGKDLFAQQTLTLQQCVEAGIQNNLQVQQSGFQMETNRINWNQARLNMLPDLNATAASGINRGRSIDPFTNAYINQQVNYSSYGISSGVILFNGLTLQNSARQAALSYEAAKMDWQQQKDNITIAVILAYLQVLSNEDLLEQSRNQAELSHKQVERLEILDKDGAIQPSQLSDLRGQYANDQLAIINNETSLQTAKVNLSQLMNVPYDKNVTLERLDLAAFATLYESSPSQIYEQALKEFSQIKAVSLRTKSAAKGVKAARGLLYPQLTLNGNANTNYSSAATNPVYLNTTEFTSRDYVIVNNVQSPVIQKQDNYDNQKITYGSQLNNNLFTSVSLNLRIPLFNALQTRNRVKLAEVNLKNTEMVEKTTKTQLQQSIEQAYINMTSASQRYKTLLQQIEAYGESFRAAEVRFNAGVGNSIDYLTAKNNLDRANINLIAAKYDFVLRTKVLDYYQGKQLW